MPWTRLDPARVIRHLRAEWDENAPGGGELSERALAHVREELLSGRYVAVQDGRGYTFIGTPEEAAEHMMGQAGERAERAAKRGEAPTVDTYFGGTQHRPGL